MPISLDDFYSKFLGDGAEQSMPSYQKAVIGDTEIVCPSWIVDSSSHQQTLKRTISFRHPINSMGMGPSSATARRVQTLSRYGHYGLIMETTTHVEGIPAADCFHVVDRWLVESEGNDEVRWTVQIESIFTKKTMLKTIIEKSTKKEIKRWYNGFVELVQREAKGSARTPAEVIVAHTSPSNDLKLCSKSKEPASLFPEWFLATVVLCCILVCALVVVQSLQTQHSLAELQREVLLLRRDQDQMITVITELMQELKRQKQGEALEI